MKSIPDGTLVVSKALLKQLLNVGIWEVKGRRTNDTFPQLICRACGGYMAWHGPEHAKDCVWCKLKELVDSEYTNYGITGEILTIES